jgi:hypothetical protein
MHENRLRRIGESYLDARETIIRLGFSNEIDWQESRHLAQLSESDFLAQAAWTILAAGFRESVVRKLFPRISLAFLHWTNARAIARRRRICETAALCVFNHPVKIRAIGAVCVRVAQTGFPSILEMIQAQGVTFLQTFPFVGSVTSYHLAKNIGLDLVKPDRHLVRLAKAAGFPSPGKLCQAISNMTGDSAAVVDIVLWCYATVTRNYVNIFASPQPPLA